MMQNNEKNKKNNETPSFTVLCGSKGTIDDAGKFPS